MTLGVISIATTELHLYTTPSQRYKVKVDSAVHPA